MWKQCGSLSESNAGLDMETAGNPNDCYKVLNMPVQNGEQRQMLVLQPQGNANDDNPNTCEGTDNLVAANIAAVAIQGMFGSTVAANFDFYTTANMNWPPVITCTCNPYIQPLQFCFPMTPSDNISEKYSNCNLYMYTFANTDSVDPSSYETIGWPVFSTTYSTSDPTLYTTTAPINELTNTLLTTWNDASDPSKHVFKLWFDENYDDGHNPYFFNIADSSIEYTNNDGTPNVYEVVFGANSPSALYITDTGLINTIYNGFTYHLCTYSYQSIQKLLWINLDGDFTFDSSVTIRCPMWSMYYAY